MQDLDPYVLPQQKAPSEQREGECPVCGLAWGEHRFGYAAFSCKAKPQPEAPGAVANGEDAGEFSSDTAALAFLRLIGNGNPNVERAVGLNELLGRRPGERNGSSD